MPDIAGVFYLFLLSLGLGALGAALLMEFTGLVTWVLSLLFHVFMPAFSDFLLFWFVFTCVFGAIIFMLFLWGSD